MIPEENKQRATEVPTEGMVQRFENLVDAAYESFSQGKITSAQLKEFYGVVGNWTEASKQVFETMNKFGIRA